MVYPYATSVHVVGIRRRLLLYRARPKKTTARRKPFFPRQFPRYRHRTLARRIGWAARPRPTWPSGPRRAISAPSRPGPARHVLRRTHRSSPAAARVSLFVKLQYFIITFFFFPSLLRSGSLSLSLRARWRRATYNGNPASLLRVPTVYRGERPVRTRSVCDHILLDRSRLCILIFGCRCRLRFSNRPRYNAVHGSDLHNTTFQRSRTNPEHRFPPTLRSATDCVRLRSPLFFRPYDSCLTFRDVSIENIIFYLFIHRFSFLV